MAANHNENLYYLMKAGQQFLEMLNMLDRKEVEAKDEAEADVDEVVLAGLYHISIMGEICLVSEGILSEDDANKSLGGVGGVELFDNLLKAGLMDLDPSRTEEGKRRGFLKKEVHDKTPEDMERVLESFHDDEDYGKISKLISKAKDNSLEKRRLPNEVRDLFPPQIRNFLSDSRKAVHKRCLKIDTKTIDFLAKSWLEKREEFENFTETLRAPIVKGFYDELRKLDVNKLKLKEAQKKCHQFLRQCRQNNLSHINKHLI